jgi:capsid protein
VGLQDDRDTWRVIQAWLSEHLCRTIFQAWGKSAMMAGALPIRVADYERVKEPTWRGRGWAWVDPLKDSQASALDVGNAFTTRTEILAEQGRDFEEVIDQLAEENAYAEKKGVAFALSSNRPVLNDVPEDATPPEK